DSMARLTLTLLGGFEGRLDGSRPLVLSARKAWALLAYLALRPGQAHPRDKLTALLWGGCPRDPGPRQPAPGPLHPAAGPRRQRRPPRAGERARGPGRAASRRRRRPPGAGARLGGPGWARGRGCPLPGRSARGPGA